ncbi:hypothetical protein APHAL10511_000812 [Amanita phalloides]|nr:hypothetical protein APHAL10511_000812 [Amanita phalloides]
MASYTDLIYAKSRHAEPRFCGSGSIAASKDFSLAMLDMANSDFRDGYATLENTIARHLGLEEPDTNIYNAEFLNRLAQDFPQYLHVIDAINPHDPDDIKEAYNTIILLQQQGRATRRAAGNKKSRLGSMKGRTRLPTVFHGSYDEQHTCRRASKIGQAVEDGGMAPWLSLIPQSIDNIVYGDNSDPDYADPCDKKRSRRSRQFSGRQGSRRSPSAATINMALHDSESAIPSLSPGGASSPELDLIQTPALSPIATFFDCDINGNEPEEPSSRLSSGLSKDDSNSGEATWEDFVARFPVALNVLVAIVQAHWVT